MEDKAPCAAVALAVVAIAEEKAAEGLEMAQKELVPAMKPCRTFFAAVAAVNGAASAASCSGEAYETAQEVVGRKSEDQKVVDRLCLRELALDYRAVLQASYWPVPNLVAVVAAGRTGSYWDHLQYKTKLVNIGDPHNSVCVEHRPGGYPG